MAEVPPPPSSIPPPPPPPPPPTPPNNPDPTQYWCHHCNKRVPIETLPGQADVICFECKNGFVEVIQFNHQPFEVDGFGGGGVGFGNEFLQILRMIASAAREDDAPPLPVDRDGGHDDFLRVELERWNRDDNEDDDDEEDEDGDDHDQENDDQDQENENQDQENDGDGEEVVGEEEEEEEDGDVRRRERRDVIRIRLRDFAARALSGRNRIVDWEEILTGLGDHALEFRFQAAGDGYVGNPGDYVDAAGYEALLQNLAENDNGKRGAPPAAKDVIEGLRTVEVKLSESEVCVICKDKLVNNEGEIVKELPCGHMYHGECIVPWLGSRNTCPVCRFELPTDDPEYEEERKKRSSAVASTSDDGV